MTKVIIIDRTESFLQSLAKDFITVLSLGFLIYISQGSKWWTFFCGLMAVMFIAAKISRSIDTKTVKAETKQEAADFIDNIDWESKS